MQKWNQRINLTGNDDDLFVIRHHFLDSLSCVLSEHIHSHIRLLDLGTGAGFPGIPLKIYAPDIHVTAVDAISKKIVFLRRLCSMLSLQDIQCVAARVEDLVQNSAHPNDKKEQSLVPVNAFDVIASRAVGTIPYLVKLARPFLAPEGYILLQRGKNGKQEITDQAIPLTKLGFQGVRLIEVNFSFFTHSRYLILLQRQV